MEEILDARRFKLERFEMESDGWEDTEESRYDSDFDVESEKREAAEWHIGKDSSRSGCDDKKNVGDAGETYEGIKEDSV